MSESFPRRPDRQINQSVGMKGTYQVFASLTATGDGINVETCLCQTGDQGIYMGAGTFYRKTDA